ncbi:MAG: S-methyl-5-thioribose-1-phosphate isomerase [candidate division WOR-3 bacterium]|nr:S-methyl-5-thioribose-1-phosphate isomerase [candidate division WOR-3 bacterium]
MSSKLTALRFESNHLIILDQTQLPQKVCYLRLRNYIEVISAIKSLKIRGAPLIGVAGAYALAMEANRKVTHSRNDLRKIAERIKLARPTAVNLSWAINRLLQIIDNPQIDDKNLSSLLISEAVKIHLREQLNSYQMSAIGANLIKHDDTIMTICNTGWLATPGIGTALGAIFIAHQQKKNIKVYVLETRPLLQGARLTTFELLSAQIPCVLITDNMMASVMEKVDLVLVGADRIAKNGDTANKIGTLTLAITAHYYQVPFYVVAPSSSFDLTKFCGKEIPVELRNPKEVIDCAEHQVAPSKVNVYNPAFDITPHNLITGFVTEKGIIRPPYIRNIVRQLSNSPIQS